MFLYFYWYIWRVSFSSTWWRKNSMPISFYFACPVITSARFFFFPFDKTILYGTSFWTTTRHLLLCALCPFPLPPQKIVITKALLCVHVPCLVLGLSPLFPSRLALAVNPRFISWGGAIGGTKFSSATPKIFKSCTPSALTGGRWESGILRDKWLPHAFPPIFIYFYISKRQYEVVVMGIVLVFCFRPTLSYVCRALLCEGFAVCRTVHGVFSLFVIRAVRELK